MVQVAPAHVASARMDLDATVIVLMTATARETEVTKIVLVPIATNHYDFS